MVRKFLNLVLLGASFAITSNLQAADCPRPLGCDCIEHRFVEIPGYEKFLGWRLMFKTLSCDGTLRQQDVKYYPAESSSLSSCQADKQSFAECNLK